MEIFSEDLCYFLIFLELVFKMSYSIKIRLLGYKVLGSLYGSY